MKIQKQICNLTLFAIIAVAAAVVWLPGSARADDKEMKPMKGGEHLLMLNKAITTPEQAEALKPGDTIAMACPKCKTIIVERVTTEKGHLTRTTPGEVHLCSGCKSIIVVAGTGKAAHNELKHVCNKCGSDSVFCCATSSEEPATKGMDEANK